MSFCPYELGKNFKKNIYISGLERTKGFIQGMSTNETSGLQDFKITKTP